MPIEYDTPESAEGKASTIFQISITKGKDTIPINTGALPDHVYEEALMLGLKVLVNRGQSDITGTRYPDEEERQEVAVEQAKKTLAEMYEGKIRRTSGVKTGKGARSEEMLEALRIAKLYVRDELKAAGKRVSLIKPAEITALAKTWIEEDPSILDEARENIAKRRKAKPKKSKIDFKAVAEDAELVEKASKKTKGRKKPTKVEEEDEEGEEAPPPRRGGRESRINA